MNDNINDNIDNNVNRKYAAGLIKSSTRTSAHMILILWQ